MQRTYKEYEMEDGDNVQSDLDALTNDVLGPTNEATNEETLTTQPEPTEAQAETTEVPETPEVPAETPVAAPVIAPVEEPEEEYQEEVFQPTYSDVPPLDLSQVPQDEEGNLDPVALAQVMQQRDQAILGQAANMVAQAEEKRQEEKLWQKAFEANPQLRSDRALAEEVNALRFGLFAKDINDGKEARMLTPMQAYNRIEKRFSGVKADAVRQATESVKVQDSVYQEPVSNAGSASADKASLYQKMRSPNKAEAEAAQDALLSSVLFGE